MLKHTVVSIEFHNLIGHRHHSISNKLLNQKKKGSRYMDIYSHQKSYKAQENDKEKMI